MRPELDERVKRARFGEAISTDITRLKAFLMRDLRISQPSTKRIISCLSNPFSERRAAWSIHSIGRSSADRRNRNWDAVRFGQ